MSNEYISRRKRRYRHDVCFFFLFNVSLSFANRLIKWFSCAVVLSITGEYAQLELRLLSCTDDACSLSSLEHSEWEQRCNVRCLFHHDACMGIRPSRISPSALLHGPNLDVLLSLVDPLSEIHRRLISTYTLHGITKEGSAQSHHTGRFRSRQNIAHESICQPQSRT